MSLASSLEPLDPWAVVRRRGADEALAAAAQLASGADDLDAVRGRLVAALSGVRWRSAAADAGRREGELLVRLLTRAVADCREAAGLLRAHGTAASR